MTRTITTPVAVLAAAVGLSILAAGCGPVRTADQADSVPLHTDDAPAGLADSASPLNPEVFLPPLDGYITEDEADPGELQASLDHGSVPYVEVRRRLILDAQGFTVGEVTVVTVRPESDGAREFLDHHYGDARRTPVQLGGVEMLRIEAEPHPALAWTGRTFAVTYTRGQEATDEWLEDLARATVSEIRRRSGT